MYLFMYLKYYAVEILLLKEYIAGIILFINLKGLV